MTAKKIGSTLLAAVLILGTLIVCGSVTPPAAAAPAKSEEFVVGTLSLLNLSEEDYLMWERGKTIGLKYLAENGVYDSVKDVSDMPELSGAIFYDSLDTMIMALEAGYISAADVPVCTADYLCANNDKLAAKGRFDLSKADDFMKQVAYRLGQGYSFLTMEDNTALRDKLDQALTEMKADGTLDKLVKTYITDAISTEPEPVEFTKTDGETIKVAITGSLPPMDYVAADGTPAGFNTAILAELGKRMNVNFDLIQVDSLGRAAALASGRVDMVFWNYNGYEDLNSARLPEEERAAYFKEVRASRSAEEIQMMEDMSGGLDHDKKMKNDLPDGTIATQTYYNDLMIPVSLK